MAAATKAELAYRQMFGIWPAQAEGLIQCRIARTTKTLVTIYRDAVVDGDEANPWATMCETHGLFVAHRTRTLAQRFAPDPETWCEGCQVVTKETS